MTFFNYLFNFDLFTFSCVYIGHVEPLIKAAAKSPNIEKLLVQRMGEHSLQCTVNTDVTKNKEYDLLILSPCFKIFSMVFMVGQYFAMWKQILRMCEGMVVEALQMRETLYDFLQGSVATTH